jgi:ATP-dependent DNA helicase DinG
MDELHLEYDEVDQAKKIDNSNFSSEKGGMLILNVPRDREDLKRRDVVDALLREALAGDVGKVTPVVSRDTFRAVHTLSKEVERRLDAAAKSCGWKGDSNSFASALLVRALEQPKVTAGAGGDSERDRLQKGMRAVAWEAYHGGLLAMIEGGTGVGKSRVMGQVASELAAGGKTVVCAAPTVANLQHLATEIREVDAKVPVGLLLGRGQLVDGEALHLWMQEQGKACPPEIREWVRKGAPCVREASMALNEAVCDGKLCWLMDDLREIAPEGFDPSDFSIEDGRRKDEDEEADEAFARQCTGGEAVYAWLNTRAEHCPVILCTLARLFAHVRGFSKAGFGDGGWDYLIVDEAHEMGRVAASTLTNSLCFRSSQWFFRETERWRPFRLGSLAERALESLGSLHQRFASAPEGLVHNALLRSASAEIAQARQALGAVAKKLRTSGKAGAARLRWRVEGYHDALVTLDGIVEGRSNELAFLVKSPVRGYPSLEVGPRSIMGLMRRLWDMTPAGGLFSGTFYLRLKTGEYSSRHIAYSELCLPSERLLECPPFVQPWLTSSPVLVTPADDKGRLAYRSDPAFIVEWRKRVTKVIRSAYASARGGVLVLVPSFEDVIGLSEGLRIKKALIVTQDQETGVRGARERFMAISARGERPLWIGTGGAWASLDLSDKGKSPGRDTLLTDLIIPRIPFGLNRGSTYEVRRAKLGHGADVLDAYFLLRQGFGRLIRRKGLKDRRIWFLDTRVYEKPAYVVFRKLLEMYPQHEALDASVL